MKDTRWKRVLSGVAVVLGGSTVFNACNGDLAKEFRDAAHENFQQGVMSLLTGLVDGTFAVLEPDPDTGDTSGT